MSQYALSAGGHSRQPNALAQLATHLWGLVAATASGWWRYAPWLVGFMLFAEAARYASLLATSQFAIQVPFLIMFIMAFGLLVNIVMIILAIRAMMASLSTGEQPSIRQVFERSIASFLVIYLAFGYMSTYTSTMMNVIQTRFSTWTMIDLLGTLNPAISTKALVTVVVIFFSSFGVGYLATFIQSRTSASWLSLVGAYMQSMRWVLGVFSITRIGEQVRIWAYARQFSLWGEQSIAWLSSRLHIDLPDLISRMWGVFTSTIWPGLWQLLVYPLVWFALVIVVAGGRLITVTEVFERVTHTESSSYARSEFLDNLLGDINVKLLPVLHALRDMLRATVPFLGAYVILFTLLTWAGDGLERLAWMVIGSRGDVYDMVALPFVDAISSALVMSFKIALLVVAFQQARILANSPRPTRHASVAHGAIVVLLAAALVAAQAGIGTGANTTINQAAPNGRSTFVDSRVTVYNLRVGTKVSGPYKTEPTPLRYVAVTVTAYSHSSTLGFVVSLIAGDHTYTTCDGKLWLSTTPGFTATTEFLFEVDTADLQGPVYAEVKITGGIQYQAIRSRYRLDPAVLSAPSEGNEIQYDSSVRMGLP